MSKKSSGSQILIPNTHEPSKPLTVINFRNPIKLLIANYLSWKLQMEAIIIGYDPHKFVDGSHPTSPSTIIRENSISPNPKF